MFSKGETENKKFYCVMQGDTNFFFEMKRPQKAVTEQERLVLTRKFIKKMALSGELNEILSSDQLFQAKKWGCLPKKFNVHHYLPLSMGGGHQDENLCVIDKISLITYSGTITGNCNKKLTFTNAGSSL